MCLVPLVVLLDAGPLATPLRLSSSQPFLASAYSVWAPFQKTGQLTGCPGLTTVSTKYFIGSLYSDTVFFTDGSSPSFSGRFILLNDPATISVLPGPRLLTFY